MDGLRHKHIERLATRRNTRPRSAPMPAHMPAPMPTPMPTPKPMSVPIVRTAPIPIPGLTRHPFRRTKSGLFNIKSSLSSSSSSSSKSRKMRTGRPPLHPRTFGNNLYKGTRKTHGIALRRSK